MDGLSIFGNVDVLRIPDKYINTRWTRNCKKGVVAKHSSDGFPGRYQQLCAAISASFPRMCCSENAFQMLLINVLNGIKEENEVLSSEASSSQPTTFAV